MAFSPIAVVSLIVLSAYSYFVYPLVLAAVRMLPGRRRPAAEASMKAPHKAMHMEAEAHIAAGAAAPAGRRGAWVRTGGGAPVARVPAKEPAFAGSGSGSGGGYAGSAPGRGNPWDTLEPVPSGGGLPDAGEGAEAPSMSLIITVHNEEARLPLKLENSLALRYPEDRLEIIVASDASTDATDAIALSRPGVRLSRAEERRGKEHAQKHAIADSRGSILVFTDVATLLDPDALLLLARDFEDPGVGAVSSEDRVMGEGGGEGLYVRYEMMLRRLETEAGSLVGLSGSFFAARREVCAHWAVDLPSDFNTVLACARMGYRAVADPEVVGRYPGIREGQSEFRRKVRTLVRGMAALSANPGLLDPRRHGFFAFQLASHKLMRWLAPVFMILLVPASAGSALARSRFGAAVLALQAAFYGLALLGRLAPSARSNPLVKVPWFFVQVNLAILAAWIRFLRGDRIVHWTPSRR